MGLETALVKEVCFGCLEEVETVIVMNKNITKKYAKQVKDLHNKMVGFSDKLCNTCTDYTDKGILLIGVINEKTTDMNNPYRSGSIAVIKDEAFLRIFDTELPKKRIALIEHEVGVNIGLWN